MWLIFMICIIFRLDSATQHQAFSNLVTHQSHLGNLENTKFLGPTLDLLSPNAWVLGSYTFRNLLW